MRVTIVLLLLALAAHTHAKVYERCELARELKCKYNIASSQLDDWVCLVESESSYDTAATHTKTNGVKDYGLFQINDKYWCWPGKHPAYILCDMDCSQLTDSSIADDVVCAKKVYDRDGFSAWDGWKAECEGKNLSSYTSGCNLTC